MLDWERLRAKANDDGEFLLHARFWNANVRLENGTDAYRMRIADGQIAAIEPWFGVVASDLSIAAPEADWQAMLAPVPKPFYQDLYAASIHHGFTTSGSTRHYCAYYPAIRRLIELMREISNG